MQVIDLNRVDRINSEMHKQQRKLVSLRERMERVYRNLPQNDGSIAVREKIKDDMQELDRQKRGYEMLSEALDIVRDNYVRTEDRIIDYTEESGSIIKESKFVTVRIPGFDVLQ